MNGCYHFLLFLSLLSSISILPLHSTPLERSVSINNDNNNNRIRPPVVISYLQLPNVTIQHVCEHQLLLIRCLQANETIQIVRSMYGRTSHQICNNNNNNNSLSFLQRTCANIDQSKQQTKLRCHGKSRCEFPIDDTIFLNPCPLNISKHFEVHYRCIQRQDLVCSQFFLNCSKRHDIKCIEKIQDEFSCLCPSTICQFIGKRIIGFTENSCPTEQIQGFLWPKTPVRKGQHLACPHPCTGQAFRFCIDFGQWSTPNYTDCQCPMMTKSESLSLYRTATSYLFRCNFWLIDRLLPEDNPCILSFTNRTGQNDADGMGNNNNRTSIHCLLSAFQMMTTKSCSISTAFGVDFQNLGFTILTRPDDHARFRMPSFDGNSIIVDRTELVREHSHRSGLAMMLIDSKTTTSLILVEEPLLDGSSSPIQTANITVIFHHRSNEWRYQCRAYRSSHSSFDASDMYFACQLLCSNGTHVICECPFFNPFMHYMLHVDTSTPQDDFELFMLDNDLRETCSKDYLTGYHSRNYSIRFASNKIDRYLRSILIRQTFSLNFYKILAKKLLSYIDLNIENVGGWSEENFKSKWQIATRFIEQIESIGLHLANSQANNYHRIDTFSWLNENIDFLVQSQRRDGLSNTIDFENRDRSIHVTIAKECVIESGIEERIIDRCQPYAHACLVISFQSIFFVVSKLDEYLNLNRSLNKLNSPIVGLTIVQKVKEPIQENSVQIIFRHLDLINDSTQVPTCAYLANIDEKDDRYGNFSNNTDVQWSTDGCILLSTNRTHSICSCNHLTAFALLIDFHHVLEKPTMKLHSNRLSFISKIGCGISIVCLILTIITLILLRRRMNIDDDLMIVRNIIHTHMSVCLLIAQLLFLFGIDQTTHKIACRVIAILLHYYLLAAFSWMFVDGIELLVALRHVFKIDRLRLLAYSLYAYGFPLLIVILSVVLSTQGYGSNKHCWLSQDNAFVWAFAIPFLLLLAANLGFFLFSLYTICKHLKTHENNQTNKTRVSLRDVATLAILFGLTWIIGLFFVHERTIIFAYAFTLLNAFQGLLIFVFYCLLRTRVQKLYSDLLCPKSEGQHFWQRHHTQQRTSSTSIRRLFSTNCLTSSKKKSNSSSSNPNQKSDKTSPHFSLPDNASSSGYGSANSSDLNKQILSVHDEVRSATQTDFNTDYANRIACEPSSFRSDFDQQLCLPSSSTIDTDPSSYLPSIPIALLASRLSTFRNNSSTPIYRSNNIPTKHCSILTHEQNQRLLTGNKLDVSQQHEDDHQYYEIG